MPPARVKFIETVQTTSKQLHFMQSVRQDTMSNICNTKGMKREFDVNLRCRICLSFGRQLSPLGELDKVYFRITEGILNDIPETNSNTDVCWECKALLRKVLVIQNRVVKAQAALKMGQSLALYGSLSNMASVSLSLHNVNLNDNYKFNRSDKLDIEQDHKNSKIINFEVTTPSECERIRDIVKSENADFNITDLQCDQKYNKRDTKYKSKRCEKRRPKYKLCPVDYEAVFKNRDSQTEKKYTSIECSMCRMTVQSGDFEKHYKSKHKSVFQCTRCGLKFGNRYLFFAHYKEWHEKYICDHCGVSFKMRYCIKKHIRKQHTPLKCISCNKPFKTYSGLWRHNKQEHTPTSPAYCVECDKSYKDIYRYKWHLWNSVKHSRKKKVLIPCTECNKTFTKKTNFTEHFDLVHLKIFKYRCEVCDKNYVRNADLKKHLKVNLEGILPPKDKMCNICGKAFSTNTILKKHLRTHPRAVDIDK